MHKLNEGHVHQIKSLGEEGVEVFIKRQRYLERSKKNHVVLEKLQISIMTLKDGAMSILLSRRPLYEGSLNIIAVCLSKDCSW